MHSLASKFEIWGVMSLRIGFLPSESSVNGLGAAHQPWVVRNQIDEYDVQRCSRTEPHVGASFSIIQFGEGK